MITGKLDTLIEVWNPTKTRRSSGQEVRTYTKLIELFAAVDYMGGVEKSEAYQKVSEINCMFTVYNRVASITEEMLVRYNSIYWEVLSVLPDKSRFYLEIVCKKRDNQNIGQ
jgi:SPP1 family predicted phage head-tail adaptor